MHNVRKVKTSEQKRLEQIEASKAKAISYLEMRDSLIQKITELEYSEDTLLLCQKVINQTPETYPFWNFRRDAILALIPTYTDEDKLDWVKKELNWNKSLIMVRPKSYWCWLVTFIFGIYLYRFHRQWIVDNFVEFCDWDSEIQLCTLALDYDHRNCN
eukprot:TRINITY_DN5503_c0_g3_i1.p1 TRINITY_DN5503_c0_g3~~TRINITY_DN5503_c0_g3_i1.p1  ORF type:complete len:158 (-),score=17.77 TRINITY_DN5503_c0_g3_i1:541-1014(-)